MDDIIAFDDCKRGGIYEVRGARFWLAVFEGPGFVGIRSKFGGTFLATESHIELGGTVEPIVYLEDVSNYIQVDMRSKRLLDFLIVYEKEIQKAV